MKIRFVVTIIGVVSVVFIVSFLARRVVYPVNSRMTKYAGDTQAMVNAPQQYMVNPIGEGEVFFVNEPSLEKYPPDRFTHTEISSQLRLIFAVGRVAGWEDIPDSQDKYLLLRHNNDEIVQKYRVAFEDSELFGDEITRLEVEKLRLPQNIYRKYKQPLLKEIGYSKINGIIKRGDVVVILPVWKLPSLSVKDDNGNYLAMSLIIRRLW